MRAAWLVVVVCALLPVAACAAGPSLDEVAAELQKDAKTLERDGLFENPLMSLRILERADKDVACGEGRFKRILSATANDERGKGAVDDFLDRSQRVMESTLTDPRFGFGYEVQPNPEQGDRLDGRVIRATKEALGITMTVDVRPDSPTWRLRAESGCLER
jgi:hypothetical protein